MDAQHIKSKAFNLFILYNFGMVRQYLQLKTLAHY